MDVHNLYWLVGVILSFIFLVYKGIKYPNISLDIMIYYLLISFVIVVCYPLVILLIPIYIGKGIRKVYNKSKE